MAQRKIKIDLRLNEEEAEELNRDVEKSGLSREAYLRALIRNRPLKERPPVELGAVLRSLQQINNNLNQIALKANAKGFVDTAAYWDNVRSLQDTVALLLKEMF